MRYVLPEYPCNRKATGYANILKNIGVGADLDALRTAAHFQVIVFLLIEKFRALVSSVFAISVRPRGVSHPKRSAGLFLSTIKYFV